MTLPVDHVPLRAASAPALVGFVAGAAGLIAAAPFGPALAQAFTEGWLAVFMDAQLFRVLCF